MILSKEQYEMARITYTQIVEDSFVLDLLDTIAAKDTQIAQLQAKIYQLGNCYTCKVSMQNEEWELIHETDKEEIARLQAQVEAAKKALDEIYNPIAYMRKEAEKEGNILSGSMALTLSDSANYLKEIARKALEAIEKNSTI